MGRDTCNSRRSRTWFDTLSKLTSSLPKTSSTCVRVYTGVQVHVSAISAFLECRHIVRDAPAAGRLTKTMSSCGLVISGTVPFRAVPAVAVVSVPAARVSLSVPEPLLLASGRGAFVLLELPLLVVVVGP